MDNAIASKEALGLSLGVSLTAEQVAALTHDIVWLEEYEVNGEKVLVPVLYLAQAEGRVAANGALIQGRDVTLISGGELNNQGTLRAGANLDVTAADIGNSGLMQASERLSLLAVDSIRNAQGGIIAGRDVSAIALTGDIVNERSVTTHESALGNRAWASSLVDSAARIEAGNSLSLSAGRDVANLGGVLDSRGDLSIDAGRDVTVASVQDLQHQSRGSTYLNERVTQLGAEVTAGRDLGISAGRDLGVIASDLKAGRDLDMDAGRDLTISSAADESHFYSKSRKVTQSTDRIVQQSSQVQAGRDIALGAGNDLSLIASQVKAGHDVALNAGQDTNILSAQDESASYYFKKSKGSFGRSKSEQKESYDSTNVASVIEAGHDLTVNTSKAADGSLSLDGGRDVTVIGSQLKAGNDLLVGGTGDVAVLSGIEEHGSYSKKTKSGFLGLSKSGKSQLKTTASQVASELEAGNDAVIAAGNDVRLRASTATAGNDAELRAGLVTDTGDINLVSANDEAYSYSEQYKKKIGMSTADLLGSGLGSPSWGGDITVASAKKAGKEAQSSTSVGSQVTADRDATLMAERDINVIGSGVSAGRNVLLDAGRDVNVVAGSSSQKNTSWKNTKTVGMQQDMDSNGYTTFFGEEKLKDKKVSSEQTAAASQIDAGLDLNVKAGRDIVQQGSDMSAGYDLNLQAGRHIVIDAAHEQSTQSREQSQERDGSTTRVNHNLGNLKDALSGAGEGENTTSQVSSTLKAVDTISQFFGGPTFDAHSGKSSQSQSTTQVIDSNRPSTLGAGNDISLSAGEGVIARGAQLDAGRDINVKARDITLDVAQGAISEDNQQTQGKSGFNAGTTGGFKVGVGGSHGTASQDSRQGTSSGSYLDAGRDINLEASHDLSLIGTQAQSGRDINLKAGNDLLVGAAGNDHVSDEHRRSGGGEVGITVGSEGFGVYASVSLGKGNLDREGTRQQEAYLYAGRDLNFESGRDTTLAGAQLEGENVNGQVGRDLTVSSVPDTGKVKGKEYDVSATVTVGYGVSVSGSVGFGETSGKTDWVGTQTSVIARDKLDIRTEDHTQIDGAVIASQTGHLKLDTDTLGFRDIQGEDREHGYYLNAGGSYGSGAQDTSQVGKGEAGVNGWSVEGYDYSKEREQIVRATVGEGEIVVRNDAETGNDSTAGLNRDLDKAYEITRDEEERTDLYVSGSSLEAVSDPVKTFSQWKKSAENYGESSEKALEDLSQLVFAASSFANGASIDEVQTGLRIRTLLNQINKGDAEEKRAATEELIRGIATNANEMDIQAVAERIAQIAENNPTDALQAIGILAALENPNGYKQNFTQALGVAAVGALGLLLLTGTLNTEASKDAANSLMEAAAKTGANVQEQLKISAELWTLILGTAFPIHQLDPKYGPLVTPIVDPLAGGNATSGGYGAGGSIITVPHTGGNQLDNQQGGTSYTTPEHQLNPGSMYSESVGNMKEFLLSPGFGSDLNSGARKTNKIYDGQSVYQATQKIGDYVKRGDQLYLDGLHKDHLEVFDSRGNFKYVLNFDGSINDSKTQSALAEGRKLK
jgi:filamentous hemagglutinin